MRLFGRQFPVWLVILYVLALSAVLLWPCVAFGSAFAFDSPGTNVPSTLRIVGIVLAYPLLSIGGVIGSYLAYRAARHRLAYGLVALALVPFALAVAGFAWSTVTTVLYSLHPTPLQ